MPLYRVLVIPASGAVPEAHPESLFDVDVEVPARPSDVTLEQILFQTGVEATTP
jgi:hypothetical protein